jgi:hypothetical protein
MEGGTVMDKDLYHPYINKDGKLVSGTAALLHHIFTVKNGLLDYHDEVGEAYVKAFIKNVSADVNAELAKQAKRDRFKVVS